MQLPYYYTSTLRAQRLYALGKLPKACFKILKVANCNIKLSISSVRISLETARCGLGEEGAVGDRRGQAERAGQAAKILSISASKASSGVL